METLLDIASWSCLILGGLFSIVGAVGMLRLPDLFTRMHAAGITDTLGAGLILCGLLLQVGDFLELGGTKLVGIVGIKLLMILGFMLITSPTATHALAAAAIAGGLPLEQTPQEHEPSTD